jgi:hypothetical protein
MKKAATSAAKNILKEATSATGSSENAETVLVEVTVVRASVTVSVTYMGLVVVTVLVSVSLIVVVTGAVITVG